MEEREEFQIPRFLTRLSYHLLNKVPPEQFRSWTERDIASPMWPLKRALQNVIWVLSATPLVGVLFGWHQIESFLRFVPIYASLIIVPFAVPRWREGSRKSMLKYFRKKWGSH